MNSHLPVGRLAEHLESLSRERAWFAIVAATTGVAAANFSFPAIGFAPLYMPVICGACRSEEHTSELQSLMRISYAVFCLKKKIKKDACTQNQTCQSNTYIARR